jgi:thiamine kinase-like enzyme
LEIDYTDNVSKSAPTHLFLKIGKPESFEGHKKEIDFYKIAEDVRMDLPIPHCFDAEYSPDLRTSYLLLQDLSRTHFEVDPSFPPTEATCERAIECLARLHASWWNHPRLGDDVGESITRDFFNQIIKCLEECTARFLDSVGGRLSKKRHELYEFVLSSYPSLYLKCIDRGMPVTLIHGDAHLGNFMFPNEIGTDTALLLDWQVWRVDFGTRDLASMMALNWYPDQRQVMEKSLLVHYHNKLLESGVTRYSWEECWLGYRVSVISNLFVPVLYFHYKISPVIWWSLLEKSFLAFQDLQCLELLDT